MALLVALLFQADLVDRLRSDDIAVRDAAERELLTLGEAALPALKKALEAEKEAEPRARPASVVSKIDRYGRWAGNWVLRLSTVYNGYSTKILDGCRETEWRAEGTAWVLVDGPDGLLVLRPTREQIDDTIRLAEEGKLIEAKQRTPPVDSPRIFAITLTVGGAEHVVKFGQEETLSAPLEKLRQRLWDYAKAFPEPLTERVHRLRSDDVATRDAAERELVKLGEAALPALRRALEAEKEAEPRARLASVVAKIEKPVRYGRGKATWRMRLTFDVRQPEPRTWFVDITGDGTGVVAPWGREVRAFALSPTREQLDEAVELAIAADVLDGDFAAVESEAKMPPGAASVFRFENGPHARTIHVRAPRDTIPEGLRRLLYFLQGPLADPAKMKGREAGELAGDLRAPGAESAEKAFRRMGKAAVPGLRRALDTEKEEAVRTRIEKLIEELKK